MAKLTQKIAFTAEGFAVMLISSSVVYAAYRLGKRSN